MKDNRDITGSARFDEELEKHGISVIRCANCNANLYVKTEEAQQGETLCPLCIGLSQKTAQEGPVHGINRVPQKKDPLLLRLVISGLHWLKN